MRRKTSESEPPTGWTERVVFSGGPEGFAYRPGEIVVGGGERGVELATRRFKELGSPEPVSGGPKRRGPADVVRLRGDVDPIEVVHDLRLSGVPAQPNHVVFAHSCSCCGPHPADRWRACVSGGGIYGSPFHASPFHASPFHASPFHASPFHASPFHASPFHASPFHASLAGDQRSGRRRSSAIPADGPEVEPRPLPKHSGSPRVAILDTGLASKTFCPAALASISCNKADHEVPDEDRDSWLDPTAGHGTFIAGLIQQLAPGCALSVVKVLTNYGDGDEVAVAAAIDSLAGKVDLLNLSFGGFALEHMHVLAAAVRRVQQSGAVVVASAGNEGTCRPTFPAALPGVVGVGAIGPDGPAPFTNYGAWVRACAPGVGLVSTFFKEFDGQGQAVGGVDPDRFESWARWSGTSFAAPVVVAALAREMACYGVTPATAVTRLIDAPGLLRIPDLGTVVNLQ